MDEASSGHRERLSGVFAPVVTPFQSGALRLDYLRANLGALGRSALAGYLALGSNGEFRSLSEAERMKVLEVFADRKGDKVVMAGASAESTTEAVRLANQVAKLGLDYASLLPPSYFAKNITDEAIFSFYSTVADGANIPIVLYNAPQFTNGVQISTRVALRLAAHPNIVGMKDSSKPGPASLLAQLEPETDFSIQAGSTTFFYPSLHLGAVGGVLSLANAIPDQCARLYDLYAQRQFPDALALHRTLVQLNQAVSGKHGVAGVKAATTIAGMKGGEPRPPIPPLDKPATAELANTLRRAGVL